MRKSMCNYNSKFFHVMVQGIRKENIFKENNFKEKFINLSKKTSKENDVSIFAYCVMNNHAHILVYTENTSNLTKMMHALNMSYANRYNSINKRCGYVFRNRYKAEEITDVSYLKNCIKYIHNNPLKAKLCMRCQDYPYSSYNEYLYKLIDTRILNEFLGNDLSYLFESTERAEDIVNFMDIENEYEENSDLTIEKLIKYYKIQNNIKNENMTKEELKPLVNMLVNVYKIPKKEIKNDLKISRYMLDNLLKS